MRTDNTTLPAAPRRAGVLITCLLAACAWDGRIESIRDLARPCEAQDTRDYCEPLGPVGCGAEQSPPRVGYICENGTWVGTARVPCYDGSGCARGFRCGGMPNRATENKGFCEPGMTLPTGQCTSAADCMPGETCEGPAGMKTCRASTGGGCSDNSGCGAGSVCEKPAGQMVGACKRGIGSPCGSTSECVNNSACDDGTCKSPKGGPCSLRIHCLGNTVCGFESRTCVDPTCTVGDCQIHQKVASPTLCRSKHSFPAAGSAIGADRFCVQPPTGGAVEILGVVLTDNLGTNTGLICINTMGIMSPTADIDVGKMTPCADGSAKLRTVERGTMNQLKALGKVVRSSRPTDDDLYQVAGLGWGWAP